MAPISTIGLGVRVIGPFRLVRTAHNMLRYITYYSNCTLQHTSEYSKLLQCARVHYYSRVEWVHRCFRLFFMLENVSTTQSKSTS